MAESQVQYIYNNNGNDIQLNLSPKRFAPYLQRAGYKYEYAFNLYLYNARLSKAFLFPLHILEVTLRNRMNSIFISEHQQDWPHQISFRSCLSSEALNSLDTAISRANTHRTDDIVATLSFDFWSNLFRPEYDRDFWQKHMSSLIPSFTISRRDFQRKIKDINHFRNRIAHHEPIHHLALRDIHSNILEVLTWLSNETRDWVHHYSSLNQAIMTAPSANGEMKPHFGDRCDKNYQSVDLNDKLANFPSNRFALCLNEDGELSAVIEKQHLASFLLSVVDHESCLYVDLKDYTYSDLIAQQKLMDNFQVVGRSESFAKSQSIFKQLGVSYVLVNGGNDILGVIAKAHRRY